MTIHSLDKLLFLFGTSLFRFLKIVTLKRKFEEGEHSAKWIKVENRWQEVLDRRINRFKSMEVTGKTAFVGNVLVMLKLRSWKLEVDVAISAKLEMIVPWKDWISKYILLIYIDSLSREVCNHIWIFSYSLKYLLNTHHVQKQF